MDRYEQKRIFYPESKRGSSDIRLVLAPHGEWVKYSDVESLQARVKELEATLRTIARGDDYISPEELDDLLKGPHDER